MVKALLFKILVLRTGVTQHLKENQRKQPPKLYTHSNATTCACSIGNWKGGDRPLICKNVLFLCVSVALEHLSNLESSLLPLILFCHVLEFLAPVWQLQS